MAALRFRYFACVTVNVMPFPSNCSTQAFLLRSFLSSKN